MKARIKLTGIWHKTFSDKKKIIHDFDSYHKFKALILGCEASCRTIERHFDVLLVLLYIGVGNTEEGYLGNQSQECPLAADCRLQRDGPCVNVCLCFVDFGPLYRHRPDYLYIIPPVPFPLRCTIISFLEYPKGGKAKESNQLWFIQTTCQSVFMSSEMAHEANAKECEFFFFFFR